MSELDDALAQLERAVLRLEAAPQLGDSDAAMRLQAERAADRARLRYATALVRYNQSQINLLAALGLIEETNGEGGPTAAPAPGAPMEPSGSAPK